MDGSIRDERQDSLRSDDLLPPMSMRMEQAPQRNHFESPQERTAEGDNDTKNSLEILEAQVKDQINLVEPPFSERDRYKASKRDDKG